MYRFCVLVFLLLCSVQSAGVYCQEVKPTGDSYKLKKDVLYRNPNDEPDEAKAKYIDQMCRVDIYYPENVKDFATIVWFHGGGLTGGSREIPDRLKNQGIAVIGVEYRLNPKVTSPVYVEDAAAAVAYAFNNISNFGGDPERIFVSGHSAGGYLTSMVGLDKRWLAKHDIDANRIAGLIPYSGHTITHFTVRAERGIDGKQPVVDDMAPLFHVRKDASPLLLVTGDRELEMLGRYEENAYFWRMMKVAGHSRTQLHELDGYNHGQMADAAHPIMIRFVKNICKQLDAKLENQNK